jgi:hypothetical protein
VLLQNYQCLIIPSLIMSTGRVPGIQVLPGERQGLIAFLKLNKYWSFPYNTMVALDLKFLKIVLFFKLIKKYIIKINSPELSK